MRTRKRVYESLTAALLAVLMIGNGLALAAPPEGKGKNKGDDGGTTEPAPVSYSITFLGTLGGEYSYPEAMNIAGDIVGTSETEVRGDRRWRHAFLIVDSSAGREMLDLNDVFALLGLIEPFDYELETGWQVVEASAINDAGQIAGRMRRLELGQGRALEGFRYTPAFEDQDGTLVAATLETIRAPRRVTAINIDGDVSGYQSGEDGLLRAIVWTGADNLVVDLGLMDGAETRSQGINDFGQSCGDSSSKLAWRFTPGVGYEDLGTISKTKGTHYANSWASAINNNGQVAGNSQYLKGLNIVQRGFRHTDGQGLLNLGTLGGNVTRAEDINNFGDVVGISQTSSGELHLFLYTDELGMIDLEATILEPLPTSELHGPHGVGRVLINDMGEVSGVAEDQAYILTPQF